MYSTSFVSNIQQGHCDPDRDVVYIVQFIRQDGPRSLLARKHAQRKTQVDRDSNICIIGILTDQCGSGYG